MNVSGFSSDGGTGTVSAGASSSQLIGANTARAGLLVTVDEAATGPVYLLLGSGTASTTAFHISLAKGGQWNGLIGEDVWGGAVQVYSATSTDKLGVVET